MCINSNLHIFGWFGLFLWGKVLLCHLDCSGTFYIKDIGLGFTAPHCLLNAGIISNLFLLRGQSCGAVLLSQACDAPAITSWVPGLQAWATIPSLVFSFFLGFHSGPSPPPFGLQSTNLPCQQSITQEHISATLSLPVFPPQTSWSLTCWALSTKPVLIWPFFNIWHILPYTLRKFYMTPGDKGI